MFNRKPIEERIAERQAGRSELREGKYFEHGPARFVFLFVIIFVVLGHLGGLVLLMIMDMN
ncbi:hypothetical protein ACWDTT_30915 [Streptosporangium sandarakinum]|uniref:Uncharacterized protein n=1 Tax=Streptosporangium sandarakinum TaxID=1260955 RepID=A0A852UW24_9ACTN|nr:hypothetical protein [Streptosporangium sandarakinum]NYF37911.1 hypothetical protein [Streptosporangium sandarakinum]